MKMAEGVGFEPTVGFRPTHAFQAGSLSHSDTPPKNDALKTSDLEILQTRC